MLLQNFSGTVLLELTQGGSPPVAAALCVVDAQLILGVCIHKQEQILQQGFCKSYP